MIGVETPGVGITSAHDDESADETSDSPDDGLAAPETTHGTHDARSGPPAGPDDGLEKVALVALAVVAVAAATGGL